MQKAFERYVNDGDIIVGNPEEEGWAFIIAKTNKNGERLTVGERVKEEVGSFVSTRWKGWKRKEIGRYWTAEVSKCTLLDVSGRRVEGVRVMGRKFEGRGGLDVGVGVLFRTKRSRPWVEKEECAVWMDGEREKLQGGETEPSTKCAPTEDPIQTRDSTATTTCDVSPAESLNDLPSTDPESAIPDPELPSSAVSPFSLPPSPQTKKKGLSAHDRKMIKKYGSLEAAAEAKSKQVAEAAASRERKEKEKEESAPRETKRQELQKQTVKKKKLSKKKQRKYDDQDDEDRMNAMIALHGNRVVHEKAEVEGEASTQEIDRDTLEVLSDLPLEVQSASRSLLSKVLIPSAAFSCIQTLEAVPKMLAALSRFEEIMSSASDTKAADDVGKSFMGVVRTIRKFGLEAAPAKDRTNDMDLSQRSPFDPSPSLSYWTPTPSPADDILYAKIVLGNAHAMKAWKYKVKLVPGTGKRGKTIKSIRNFWTNVKLRGSEEERKIKEVEIECINGIGEEEAANGCIGDVRCMEKGFK
jgi:hypothetical protein